MQVDSLNILVPQVSEGNLVYDTNVHVSKPAAIKNTFIPKIIASKKVIPTDSILTVQSDTIQSDTLLTVSNVPSSEPGIFNLFSTLQKVSDSTAIKFSNPLLEKRLTSGTKTYTGPEPINTYQTFQKSWVLGFAMISVTILIIIRLNFNKYLATILSSIFNIQTAEKLMREKNILVRRVFFLLNINFVFVTSLFFYLFIEYYKIPIPIQNQILVFLCILGLLIVFLLVRLAIQYLVGYIFDSEALFKEYIHNTYLLNKNIGLYLLPMVISVFYLNQNIADIVFYISGGFFAIALLYRYLKAIQIIIKYKAILFYSFLYLCTLEILPISIGIKYILLLS